MHNDARRSFERGLMLDQLRTLDRGYSAARLSLATPRGDVYRMTGMQVWRRQHVVLAWAAAVFSVLR